MKLIKLSLASAALIFSINLADAEAKGKTEDFFVKVTAANGGKLLNDRCAYITGQNKTNYERKLSLYNDRVKLGINKVKPGFDFNVFHRSASDLENSVSNQSCRELEHIFADSYNYIIGSQAALENLAQGKRRGSPVIFKKYREIK